MCGIAGFYGSKLPTKNKYKGVKFGNNVLVGKSNRDLSPNNGINCLK